MHSYFDKENKLHSEKQQPLSSCSSPSGKVINGKFGSRSPLKDPLGKDTLSPLKPRTQNKINTNNRHSSHRLSLTNSIRSVSTKSSRISSDQSRKESGKSHIASSGESHHSGRSSKKRHSKVSIETSSTFSSSAKVITDEMDNIEIGIARQVDVKAKNHETVEHKANLRGALIEEPMSHSIMDRENEEQKPISKSASFRRLRNSLSMKSIASSFKNDDDQLQASKMANSDRRNSLKSRRKMSLENIRSFLKPNRSSLSSNVDYKNNISLPIMQPQTKDKIIHKLRNSNSVVSISSFVSQNNLQDTQQLNNSTFNQEKITTSGMKSYDINQIHLSILLKLCSQSKPVSFRSYMNNFQSSTQRKHLSKLDDRAEKFVFMEFSSTGKDYEMDLTPSGVWKVIPFDLDGSSITKLIQELTLSILMSNKKGFVKIKSAKVVKGPCPSSVLDLVGPNDEKITSQLFLIMRLDYGGQTLKDYHIESWKDASLIFSQILDAMCLGEDEGYEHRDLNVTNILISHKLDDFDENAGIGNHGLGFNEKNIEVSIIDHALARGIVSGQVIYRDLYDADFFRGSNEYRHVIYKLMRKVVNNRTHTLTFHNSTSAMSINTLASDISTMNISSQTADWSKSYPIFNLLWIHYIVHNLLFENELKPIKMNPILKKKGWLVNGGEMSQESAVYEKLLQGYKMVEPAVLFGQKRNKYMREVKNIYEFRDWYHSH
ncbi:hypothetical protein PP714_08165 [Lacticaseibacillus paracasei]|nr:hypothetical protein [Lacticaseibacillus paracasei]